jgi:hypothetical protein
MDAAERSPVVTANIVVCGQETLKSTEPESWPALVRKVGESGKVEIKEDVYSKWFIQEYPGNTLSEPICAVTKYELVDKNGDLVYELGPNLGDPIIFDINKRITRENEKSVFL